MALAMTKYRLDSDSRKFAGTCLLGCLSNMARRDSRRSYNSMVEAISAAPWRMLGSHRGRHNSTTDWRNDRKGDRAAGCLWLSLVASFLLAISASLPAQAQIPAKTGPSGLPLPRYVSLKSDRVNLRQGPGTDYPTAWVYRRAGLPLEVTEEYETWRKVRDAEGTTGWILSSLLSGRRTALVLPWELKPGEPRPQLPLLRSNSERSEPVAMIEAGVIADIQSCDGAWCYVAIDSYKGYLEQAKLWGVYENESVK